MQLFLQNCCFGYCRFFTLQHLQKQIKSPTKCFAKILHATTRVVVVCFVCWNQTFGFVCFVRKRFNIKLEFSKELKLETRILLPFWVWFRTDRKQYVWRTYVYVYVGMLKSRWNNVESNNWSNNNNKLWFFSQVVTNLSFCAIWSADRFYFVKKGGKIKWAKIYYVPHTYK